MPTYTRLEAFFRDYKKLTGAEQQLFLKAVQHFVNDLKTGKLRPGLRVKKMQGHENIWEMTWAPDGRATFEYGPDRVPGEIHVIWRRIGGHEIFCRP